MNNTQRPPAVTVAVVLLALLSVVNMVPASRRAYTSGGYVSEVDKPLGKRVKGEHR